MTRQGGLGSRPCSFPCAAVAQEQERQAGSAYQRLGLPVFFGLEQLADDEQARCAICNGPNLFAFESSAPPCRATMQWFAQNYCMHEANASGFWLHRLLEAHRPWVSSPPAPGSWQSIRRLLINNSYTTSGNTVLQSGWNAGRNIYPIG